VIFSVVLGGAGAESARRAILPQPEVSFLVHLFLRGWRLRPVDDGRTLFNVPLSGFLAEPPRTVWTLHHVLLVLGRYLVRKCPDLVLYLRVVIHVWIFLQFVNLLSNAHGLDELFSISFPLRYVFLILLNRIIQCSWTLTRDSFGSATNATNCGVFPGLHISWA